MSYYEFPHTRNYNQDLGYLIKLVQNLQTKLEELEERVKALEEKDGN